MADDVCGHPTAAGDPCQHPTTDDGDPDRCWLEGHNETAVEADQPGRPSKLEEYEDDILAGARQGMTLEGCARLAGVDESTLHRWKNEHEEFRKSLRRARAQGELQHLQTVNDAGSRFILERSFGYVKTEKREVAMDAEVESTHDVTAEFVTYTPESNGDE